MDFLALLTAFGTGSIVTVIVQSWLSGRLAKRQKIYDERKEAYIGLLQSWMEYESSEPSKKGEYEIGHWLLRSQFVASKPTLLQLNKWEQTIPGSPERVKTTVVLKSAMREDLCSF